jgi:hypothetical protein
LNGCLKIFSFIMALYNLKWKFHVLLTNTVILTH